MYTFIKKSLIFCIYSIGMYIIFLFTHVFILKENFKFSNLVTFDKKPPYLKYKINELKKQDFNNIDILFLGSSHAEGGFDARIFEKYGFKTFNLGSSAQTPVQTEILLKRYLEKTNPKLIIYDVFPGAFNTEGIEASIDLIRSDDNNFDTFKLFLQNFNIKLFNLFIYKYINDKINLTKRDKKIFANNEYVKNGFVDYGNGKFYPNLDKVYCNKIINPNSIESFKKNIDLINKTKIPFIFIRLPETKHYNNFVNNTQFDSIIHKFGVYYNLNKFLNLNDTVHFIDDNHLNNTGVKVANEYIINKILKNNSDKIK